MARRIDIELTSTRPDGTWTWRVAGAKQPKGVVGADLVPPGAKVGDVLRADAEFELEGTVITAMAAPQGKRPEPGRLELIADPKPFEGVTTSLVPKGGRPPRREHDERGGRPDRIGGRPGPRGDGAGRPEARPGDGRGPRPERGTRPDRGARPDRGPRPPRPGDGAGTTAGAADQSGARRPRPEGTREGTARPGGAERAARRPAADARGDARPSGPARPKRLSPTNTHRNVVLDSLAPEERAVAEQLLHGGIPAVRRAVQEQNAKARTEGMPEVKAEPLLALAEELLPRLKGAEWRDRADAAAKDIDEIGLRDLRSVVAGAEAGARDDESRILAKTLREALDRRDAVARDTWVAEITTCLDEGRVTRALRVAGRPPDPRTRFPTELIGRLTEAASAAMGPETPPDRWTALLAAVLESPVRRSVKPAGLPAAADEALVASARQASGRIPALAALLGLQMPPPPGPPRPPARPPRPERAPGRVPPPPPATGTATAARPAPLVDTSAAPSPPPAPDVAESAVAPSPAPAPAEPDALVTPSPPPAPPDRDTSAIASPAPHEGAVEDVAERQDPTRYESAPSGHDVEDAVVGEELHQAVDDPQERDRLERDPGGLEGVVPADG